MSQNISGLVANRPASPANLTGAAAIETTDKNVATVGVTYNQLRTALAAGGTGYAADAWAGDLTGNAATATKLVTARHINGVLFDGSADVTVPAAAGTLSGTALPSGIVSSSLASFGALAASLLLSADNVYDLGDGTHRFRNLYLSNSITAGGQINFANAVYFDGAFGAYIDSSVVGAHGGAIRVHADNGSGGVLAATFAAALSTLAGALSVAGGLFTVRLSDGLTQFSGGLFALVDNAYDIGASSSNRPRHAYIAGTVNAGSVVAGGSLFRNDSVGIELRPVTANAATYVQFENSGGTPIGQLGFLGNTGTSGHLYIANATAGGTIRFALAATSPVAPDIDNANPLGSSGNRWTSVWAVNGTIQTSLKEAKDLEAAQPTDDDVLAAIRGAEIGAFTYKGDHGYNKLGHKHRHFSPMHHSLPTWAQTTDDGLNALTIAGLGLKGVQLLERRIAALEAKLAA